MRARLRGGGGARRAREKRWRPEARARARAAQGTDEHQAPAQRHALVTPSRHSFSDRHSESSSGSAVPSFSAICRHASCSGRGRRAQGGADGWRGSNGGECGANERRGTQATPAPSAPALTATHRHRARRLHEQRLHRVVQQVHLRAEIRERGRATRWRVASAKQSARWQKEKTQGRWRRAVSAGAGGGGRAKLLRAHLQDDLAAQRLRARLQKRPRRG